MMSAPLRLLAIGEVMAEIRAADAPAGTPGIAPGFAPGFAVQFGGDTYNTAVYAARLVGDVDSVAYLTRIGRDPLSTGWMEAARGEL